MKLKPERTTAISDDRDQVPRIRGYDLTELLKRVTFGEAVYLILRGELPTLAERAVFDACLVAAIDHGVHAPSTDVARRVASNGNSVNTAVGAGIAAIGDHHGGAIEQCGQLLQDAMRRPAETRARFVVEEGTRRFRRVPGYGHRVYRDTDPRAEAILSVVEGSGLTAEHSATARATVPELEKAAGRHLPLNIDGAMAAALLDLGFPPRTLRGIFCIARTPGLAAHVVEQLDREPPVLRSDDPVAYDGPAARSLPAR